MKVNMIMCVIMVITYCFIPILYYGFVHGYHSWIAKQTNHSNHLSLFIYPHYPSGPHHPPACIVSRNASWQITPVALQSGSLRILTINLLTLTGFIPAACFQRWTIPKWPPEVDIQSITLPVHAFSVLYVRHWYCHPSYKESSETALLEAASSSVVTTQSLLVSRLAIKLRQSAQKGDIVVTGPRHCLVLSCSHCVWMANNIMKMTAPHQNPPMNRQIYIVFVHVSFTSKGSSVTPKLVKLMLYIMMP